MQNHAILRNALRKRNYELPSVSNDMQSSEVLRNSLGLNYKSAALSGGTAGCKISKRAKLTLYSSAGGEMPKFVRLARRESVNS